MKRIAIDMDEVIADFHFKHLNLYNKDFSETLTKEDLYGTRLWNIRPHISKEILAYVDDSIFFRDLAVIDGSQEVIKDLSEQYEIFIVTAAMEHPSSFTAKYEWLKEHFPFLTDRNFVFCGDKSIIRADYLIDDSPKNIERFIGQGLLFTAPHNIHETRYLRVNNWQEVKKLLLNDKSK
ncbi:5'-3'-deoxyribonucleotidase [Paenibacillus sp. N5-1-1-5]|uniref:5'-3'-deoxyribonucleotidase n=1 Tax=Paenibacillus radicis (ex Xue et al. 2023) TaxID=2972489 RepID=A0ABT1YFX1_9BACL|nr:5'-3'-deoxyribonucleotidase [Paenibacillus radicis (ex Xue et al. 2023)]MCR8632096.1 5'-3'-deoxyribonucleotidase [Paenibacillus radicis (ex Xue et al. 2023)]